MGLALQYVQTMCSVRAVHPSVTSAVIALCAGIWLAFLHYLFLKCPVNHFASHQPPPMSLSTVVISRVLADHPSPWSPHAATANYCSALLLPVAFLSSHKEEITRVCLSAPGLFHLTYYPLVPSTLLGISFLFLDVRDSNMYTYHVLKGCLIPLVNT